ncbi:MAG: hypothetical protein KC729_14790, partial [Candidatus Eisenbacteria bacterium]|nr:hypothetical protein [Candidatus Eisenbacteria bacterium]
MIAERPTVAHLVTPYLFLTGSWIHSQLAHARRTRPVVITQSVEHRDVFPFEQVHDLSGRTPKPIALLSKYLRGHYPEAPYRRVLEDESVR